MTDVWKETQTEAIEASEDFKVICETLLHLKTSLSHYYNIFVGEGNAPNRQLSQPVLETLFTKAQENAKISFVAEQRRHGNTMISFDKYFASIQDKNKRDALNNYITKNAWSNVKGQYLEALCLLATIDKMTCTRTQKSINLFSKFGPFPLINDDEEKRYVWTQPDLSYTTSGLKARPDIVITSSEEGVTKENIIDIIECKCVKKLNSKDIRSEFGKAHDLGVLSYTIVAYHQASSRLINGAKNLGLTLVNCDLYSKDRMTHIQRPIELVNKLSTRLDESRKSKDFLHHIENSAEQTRMKLLSSN